MMFGRRYVRMCRALPEMQVGHRWEEGDWFFSEYGGVGQVGRDSPMVETTLHDGDPVWLPRVDQLMMMGDWHKNIHQFAAWLMRQAGYQFGVVGEPLGKRPAMDVLALAYLQYQDGKVWNGKRWENNPGRTPETPLRKAMN